MKKVLWVMPIMLMLGLSACGNHGDDRDSSSAQRSTSSAAPAKSKQDTDAAVSGRLPHNIKLGLADAWTTFTDHHNGATVTNVELKKLGAAYAYQFEGVSASTEFETIIDAQSGKVTRDTNEPLDADEANGVKKHADGIALSGLQDLIKITQAAEKQVGGTVSEWELGKDDAGQLVWQVDVMSGAQKIEVDVDAKSGKVLNAETDD